MIRSTDSASRKQDAIALLSLLTAEIRKSGLSRDQIASAMTVLSDQEVTVRQLYGYTAESREDFPWPGQLDIIFCEVVGSYRLLAERVKRAGFRLIGPKEGRLIALGKAWEQKRRVEQILNGGGK